MDHACTNLCGWPMRGPDRWWVKRFHYVVTLKNQKLMYCFSNDGQSTPSPSLSQTWHHELSTVSAEPTGFFFPGVLERL